ncbi:aminoglycoside phosphotransferase family protein [Streptomyces tubbatahanensis]|uniref:Aminoglycoside phosphotransferase family protein n=1 Tax=Streptomyces tubbatahanensis TaxID=2923272 RepID=A0ABY3XZJ3_9ACTN|nr:phosphotransferase [Streptomyces tubbatahanensis]UNS99941.1 aminoglycoside phosphotransferase family protein [Streptomyces tubbatahanensis]
MAGFLTPDQLAARTSRARDAAVAAGRALGLTVTDARVLHDVFSVVVHLAPSPVVVRVPTVLPSYADPDTQAARQRRELDVVGWLAQQGTPVIPPSPLVPAEPVRRDEFSMTFWQYVEQDSGTEPDYVRNSGLVAGLHAALRAYPGRVPFLSAAEPEFVTDALAVLQERPDLLPAADLDRARREWEILEPVVRTRAGFEAAFPGVGFQPIHGDAPAVNIVSTEGGELYSDFELVTYGPVEWDLAALGPEGEAAYNAAARRAGLRALDERAVRLVNAVGASRAVACLALAPQLPLLVEALEPALDTWRAAPFAGGLSGLSADG